MMHKDTMLKFGALFDVDKYFEHTLSDIKFQRTRYGRGLVAPTLNFGTPSLSQKLIELESWKLAHL